MCSGTYVVVRTDQAHPTIWFRAFGEFGQAISTIHYSQAARLGYDDAKKAIFGAKIDFGGRWEMRRVDEDGNPGGGV